jgi:hypothetical protein
VLVFNVLGLFGGILGLTVGLMCFYGGALGHGPSLFAAVVTATVYGCVVDRVPDFAPVEFYFRAGGWPRGYTNWTRISFCGMPLALAGFGYGALFFGLSLWRDEMRPFANPWYWLAAGGAANVLLLILTGPLRGVPNPYPEEARDPVDEEGTRLLPEHEQQEGACPRCGFKHSWANGHCGHCGYVAPPTANAPDA